LPLPQEDGPIPEPDADSPLIPSPEWCAALIVALIQDPRVRDVVAPLAAQAALQERTLAALLGDEPPAADPRRRRDAPDPARPASGAATALALSMDTARRVHKDGGRT
jgi:hypothetical protein